MEEVREADEQLEFHDAEEEVAGPPPVIANPYRREVSTSQPVQCTPSTDQQRLCHQSLGELATPPMANGPLPPPGADSLGVLGMTPPPMTSPLPRNLTSGSTTPPKAVPQQARAGPSAQNSEQSRIAEETCQRLVSPPSPTEQFCNLRHRAPSTGGSVGSAATSPCQAFAFASSTYTSSAPCQWRSSRSGRRERLAGMC